MSSITLLAVNTHKTLCRTPHLPVRHPSSSSSHNPRRRTLAPALFLCYDSTKFLAAWPSGFQDLLAVFLMLAAVEAHARGRIALSRVAIALAPFAKETASWLFPWFSPGRASARGRGATGHGWAGTRSRCAARSWCTWLCG